MTRVDTASLLSLPLSSKAPTESQMLLVDSALLPEYHLHSAEEFYNNIPEHVESQLPFLEGNRLRDTHSGLHVHSKKNILDSSFSQIEPTPSGLSVESLALSTEVLAPDLSPQTQLLDPELVVLWPSSHAPSMSVSQFSVHSEQRGLIDIHTLPDESHHSAADFIPLTTAGVWALEGTRALHHTNTDRIQPVHSALSATISSSNLLSHHLHNLSLTVSTETLPAATAMPEQMVGEEIEVSSSSLSPVFAPTPSSWSRDRHASSLTFNRALLGLQQTISRVRTDQLTGYDDTFNYPTSPMWNPSVMATTQTQILGSITPQHASGLDYMYQPGSTQTNTEQPDHLSHNPNSAHKGMHTHLGAQMIINASEMLNLSQWPEQETQNAEAHVDVRGLQQQSSHFISFTPPLLSPSILPSLSLLAILTPPFPSLQISAAVPADITVSPLPLSSSLSPLLSGRMALPAVSASMAEAKKGSLLPSWLIAGFHQHTTTQSPLDSLFQSLQRSPTYPVSQSTESAQQFITASQSLLPDQASTLPDNRFKSSHYDDDEVSLQLVDASVFISGAVSSPEASKGLTAAGKLLHLSALFDPSNVVPKIHPAVELAASSAVNTSVTLDGMLNAPTDHDANENLDLEAAPNTRSFPVEMQTTSPCPTSQPGYQPSSAVTEQTTGAPVMPNPLHTSGLNIPSFMPVSTSPTGSSISAPGQGLISGFDGLPPPDSDNQTENTASSKHTFVSNATTLVTLKDSETTKAKNATLETGNMEAPQGNLTGSKPEAHLSVNESTPANLTLSKLNLNSTPSVLNHSGSSGASWVNVAVNPDQHDSDAHLSPTLPGLVGARHFTTTKNSSSLTAPFKAVSVSASSSGGLKKATTRPGSSTLGLAAEPALPCQCKQRFHFTCLCGLSSGNSMSCRNKKTCRCRESFVYLVLSLKVYLKHGNVVLSDCPQTIWSQVCGRHLEGI